MLNKWEGGSTINQHPMFCYIYVRPSENNNLCSVHNISAALDTVNNYYLREEVRVCVKLLCGT